MTVGHRWGGGKIRDENLWSLKMMDVLDIWERRRIVAVVDLLYITLCSLRGYKPGADTQDIQRLEQSISILDDMSPVSVDSEAYDEKEYLKQAESRSRAIDAISRSIGIFLADEWKARQ
jgi:hypothetical protein